MLRQEWYPFNFVLPDGSLFTCGPTQAPADSSFRNANPEADSVWRPYPSGANKIGFHPGSAVMYRPGRILVAGANDLHGGALATRESRWIALDSTSATWTRSINLMRANRANHNLVLLPNGQVLAVGGTEWVDDNLRPNKRPEIWDPLAYDADSSRYGLWSITAISESLAAQAQVRGYHSTAVLLPDGRILSAGGNNDHPGEHIAEVYCPPYLFNASGGLAARPEITSAPAAVSWGSTFTVCVSDTTGIRRAALIAPGAATHGFDQNQRYIPLTFTRSPYGQKLYLTAPANGNVASPGYYLLFLVGKHDGTTHHPDVPSVAAWVRVNPGGRDTCDTVRPAIQTDFGVDVVTSTAAYLAWTEHADDSVATASGRVSKFDVRKYHTAITSETVWNSAPDLAGEPQPTGAGNWHEWTLSSLTPCTNYFVAGRSHDDNNNLSLLHGSVSFTTLGQNCGPYLFAGPAGSSGMRVTDGADAGESGAGSGDAMDRGGSTASSQVGGGGHEALVVETIAGESGGWTVRVSRVTDVAGVAAADAGAIVAQVPDGAGGWRTVNRITPPEGEDLAGLCALRDGGRYVLPAGYSIEQVATSLDGAGGALTVGEVGHSSDGSLTGASLADPSATDLAPGESLTAEYAQGGAGEAEGSWHLLVRRAAAEKTIEQGGAGSAALLPARFALLQNAPNPFGATTTIGFELPRASRVKIELFDLLGRRVRTLTDQVWPAGRHGIAWDRLTDRGERLYSGVLLYRMTAADFRDQKKLVIGTR